MSNAKPWLEQYSPGVSVNIDPDKYETVVEVIEQCCKQHKNKPMYENMGKALTYGQIDQMSTQFGAYLHSRGLQPKDKIAIMMPNLLQYPIAIIGALKAGLIVVNTNPLYTPREMKHQFTDSEVKAILILDNFAHNLEKIIDETNIKTVILTSIGSMLSPVKGFVTNLVVRHVKRMVPKYNLKNTVTFKEALKQGSKFQINPFEQKASDVILHQYTGGTTGVSKGAMLTNRNLIANMLQTYEWMKNFLGNDNADEVVLAPLPMYHIFAFTVHGLSTMSIGAHTVLITNPRDMSSIVKEFKKHKFSLISGLNTLFNAMLNDEKFVQLDFTGLKITIAGGMAVQRAVAERWESVTKCRISEGYGMTETSPIVCCNPFHDPQIGTVGIPVSNTNVRIIDEDYNPLAPGEVGEIQIQGPQVMKGYFNRPDETNKILKDGWLSTGDIGVMDEKGFFRIVDRKKDMILVSGFNVYPNEIEDVVATHPKVLEVAAIGIPHEKSGEAVKIFVVKKDASLTEDEIIAHCRQGLTGYKIPKAVEWRDELPKSNVGKILRRKLKEA